MDSLTPAEPADAFYRRRLPHWQPATAIIFLTWRLHGSLPREALERLAAERALLKKQPLRPGETGRDRAQRDSKGLFGLTDDMLASRSAGPTWLADDRIARLMVDNLFHYDGRLYTLHAFVIMPNHVHVLVHPLEKGESAGEAKPPATKPASRPVPLSRITQALKGYVAYEANRLLARTGLPFWQDESYDHWVRSVAEYGRIVAYIENDPVRSGLAGSPEEWRWSSAWERLHGRLAEQAIE